MRGGRMIVNPVRYGSGGNAKTTAVKISPNGNTVIFYLDENGTMQSITKYSTVTITTIAKSLIVTWGNYPLSVTGAEDAATVSRENCYIFQADA